MASRNPSKSPSSRTLSKHKLPSPEDGGGGVSIKAAGYVLNVPPNRHRFPLSGDALPPKLFNAWTDGSIRFRRLL